jgi:hypothetical protein
METASGCCGNSQLLALDGPQTIRSPIDALGQRSSCLYLRQGVWALSELAHLVVERQLPLEDILKEDRVIFNTDCPHGEVGVSNGNTKSCTITLLARL